jgi:hypothetical protein
VGQQGMGPSVRADSLTGLMERSQLLPSHVAGSSASPAYGYEEACRDGMGLQNRERELEVGDMPVIEGHLRAQPRSSTLTQFDKEADLLLELFRLYHVGIAAPSRSQFVVEKIKPVRQLSHGSNLDSTSNFFFANRFGCIG